MDEEYELDTLLDIILDYVDVNQKEYAKTVDRLPVCPFRHANPAGNQPTSSRRAVRLLQYFQQTGLGYPLPEHDPERVSPIPFEHWNELGKCYLQQEPIRKGARSFRFRISH